MKALPFLLLAVLAAVLLPACTQRASSNDDYEPSTTTSADAGAAVVDQAAAAPQMAPLKAGVTRYIAHLRTTDNKPVVGVTTMFLSEKPEPLYMREPRRAMVIGTWKAPAYARVHYEVENDGKPKYLWCGRNGVSPFLTELPAATGGEHEMTVTMDITPVATFVIEDHQGMRCPEAIVTMKLPNDASAPESSRPNQSENYGTTERADDLGVVRFTRPPGKYHFIATKANGTCRLITTVDWNGSSEERIMRLPEKSPGQ